MVAPSRIRSAPRERRPGLGDRVGGDTRSVSCAWSVRRGENCAYAMRLLIAGAISALLCTVSLAQDVSGESAAIVEETASARAALDRAAAAREAGDEATARLEVVLAIELLAALPLGHGHDPTAILLSQAGQAAYSAGELFGAREAWSRVLEHFERTVHGDHPDLITTRNNLGAAVKAMGDLAGALALEEKSLASCERTLPAHHPLHLMSRLNLASTLCKMGDLAGARVHQVLVVEARERTLSEDHPHLLLARHNLALTVGAMGDRQRERALLEQVLAAYERTRPEYDRYLTLARVNLANVLRYLGEHDRVRALEELVLEARERTLPEDHPDLVSTRAALAATLRVLGELGAARELREKVLESRSRTLPADHHLVLEAQQNVASVLYAMGEHEQARDTLTAVLSARERTLPPDDFALLRSRHSLAAAIKELGDLAGARALFESALNGLERTVPEDHPELLLVRQNLAITLTELGDLPTARRLHEVVLATRERTLHGNHQDVLSARQSLAATIHAMGEYSAARRLFESILAERERTLPEDHPKLLDARQNVAATLRDIGDRAGARALYEDVLASRERTLPSDHAYVLSARQNLAEAMKDMGDALGARAIFEAILASYERTRAEDHPDIRHARRSLAGAMNAQGDLERARPLQELVLANAERVLPNDHLEILSAREALASTLRKMGEFAAARSLQESVLETRQRVLTDELHPDLLRIRLNHAQTISSMGDIADAHSRQSALLADLNGAPPESTIVRTVQHNLAVSKILMGDVAGARALGFELARGMLASLEHAWSLSPREARAAAAAEARGHALVRYVTGAAGSEPATVRFDLSETLRAVSADFGQPTHDGDPRRLELLRIRTRLSDLVVADRSSDELAAEVARLTFERDRIEGEIRGESAALVLSRRAVRAERVALSLPAGAAAVGFLRYGKLTLDEDASRLQSKGDALVAHVLLPDGSLAEFELGPAEQLEELAQQWRQDLGAPIRPRGVSAPHQPDDDFAAERAGILLREHLLDPVLAAIGESTTLHICLDDFLHVVPLEALPLDEGVVGDRVSIVVESSFQRLLATRPVPIGLGLLAVGDVAYDGEARAPDVSVVSAALATSRGGGTSSFVSLAETLREAKFASDLFEATFGSEPVLLLDTEATKAALHETAPGKRYLHIATHGWFAPETVSVTLDSQRDDALWTNLDAAQAVTGLAPMTLCGLAFAGANRGRDSLARVPGILTAEELAGIDLSACQLAVLSACETNVGIRRAGQGVQSLQAALHTAGARTAITSLWRVDDAMTRRLMELFYKNLWANEQPMADALWKAKCDLQLEGAPVRDWAGWVLSGDPE